MSFCSGASVAPRLVQDLREFTLMCSLWYRELVFCVVLRGGLPLVGFWLGFF